MSERLPTIFCDGIMEANVVNGVVRITLGQAGGDGKPIPCGQLVLPLTQLPAVANAMMALVKQVQEKMQEQAAKAQAQAPAQTQGGAAELPSAFKFS